MKKDANNIPVHSAELSIRRRLGIASRCVAAPLRESSVLLFDKNIRLLPLPVESHYKSVLFIKIVTC